MSTILPANDLLYNLNQLNKLYDDYGFKKESEKLLSEIRKLSISNHNTLNTNRKGFKMDYELIEFIISQFNIENTETLFKEICFTFLPNKQELESRQKADTSEFANMLHHKKIDPNGRIVSSSASTFSDMEFLIVQEYITDFQISFIFLRQSFEYFKTKNLFNAKTISGQIKKALIYSEDNKEIIKKALKSYFKKDYIVFMHLIIPQIENIVRSFLEFIGGNVLVKKQEIEHLKTLDKILSDSLLEDSFGKDFTAYLKVLFTSNDGWNLRNTICHGIADKGIFNEMFSDRVLHSLLCLSDTISFHKTKIHQEI